MSSTPQTLETVTNGETARSLVDDELSAGSPKKTRRPRAKKAIEKPSSPTKAVIVKKQPANSQVELRKAVEAITIRNVSTTGEITLLQRKAFNAMLQIAQQSRKNDEITFEVPIAKFEDLVGHTTSNSREYLKQVARQLASMQVEFDFKGESSGRKSVWGIANMVAEVYISEDGDVIKFSFPPEMAKRLLDPEMYNRIDMRLQNLFTSYSALTLYETVSRYYGFPRSETYRDHWTGWSILLSGASKPHAQFRDFNKMLTRAIDQVNTHQNRFKIVLHVSKRGRKMDKMWFVLENQQQGELGLSGVPTFTSDELLKRLECFGLSKDEIHALAIQYDEEYLLSQADYTDKRLKKKGADPLENPKAYFNSAVEKNYADAPRKPVSQAPTEPKLLQKPTQAKVDAKQALDSVRDAWKKAHMDRIRIEFQNESDERKAEIIRDMDDEFSKNSVVYSQYKKKGINKMVESVVTELLFNRSYSEPSAEELLQFAFETGTLLARSEANDSTQN